MRKRMQQLGLLVALGVTLLVGCKGATPSQGEQTTSVSTSQETTSTGAKEVLAKPVVITNELNGESFDVVFETVPQRGISLSGFMTEMYLTLGIEDRLVGYGWQDNPVLPQYEEAIAKVEEISKAENPSKEVVLSKEPDFMTGWSSTFSEKNFSRAFCEENGIKIYLPKGDKANATMEDVYADFENLGKIYNVEAKAQEVIASMRSEIESVTKAVEGIEAKRVFVYDSGDSSPFTASAGLATDMIRLAGGTNIFAGEEKAWMEVSWEEVVSKNPEVIIIMDYADSGTVEEKENTLLNHPAMQEVDAIKNKKIFVLGLSDVMGGERNPAAVKKMAMEFHPEAFK